MIENVKLITDADCFSLVGDEKDIKPLIEKFGIKKYEVENNFFTFYLNEDVNAKALYDFVTK